MWIVFIPHQNGSPYVDVTGPWFWLWKRGWIPGPCDGAFCVPDWQAWQFIHCLSLPPKVVLPIVDSTFLFPIFSVWPLLVLVMFFKYAAIFGRSELISGQGGQVCDFRPVVFRESRVPLHLYIFLIRLLDSCNLFGNETSEPITCRWKVICFTAIYLSECP